MKPTPLLLALMACTGPGTAPTPPITGDDDPLPLPDLRIEQGDPARCAKGQDLYATDVLHTVDLVLSDRDWDAMIAEADASLEYGGPDKTYFQATASFDGVALDSPVAIRLKGHSSLIEARDTGRAYPFKVDINRVDDDQELDGIKKLNLHPNLRGITVANEVISYGAIRDFGIPTVRVAPAEVTLNGTALGLYTLVEHPSGDFVRCHFAGPHGDLYKPEEPVGNLNWLGDSIADYGSEMEHKWPDNTDHASLLGLLRALKDQPAEQLGPVLDIPAVLAYLAVNAGTGNYDYYASYGHNYYLFEADPGRFTMIPWDMNFSQTELPHPCGLGRNTEEWPVSHKLLGDERYTDLYLRILTAFLEQQGSVAAMNERLDTVVGMLSDRLDEDGVEAIRGALARRVQSQTEKIASGALSVCPVFTD